MERTLRLETMSRAVFVNVHCCIALCRGAFFHFFGLEDESSLVYESVSRQLSVG